MKNFKTLLHVALVGAFAIWLTGCDTEEPLPDGPIIGNIDVVPAAVDQNIEVTSGEDVTFSVDVTTAAGFNVARLYFNDAIVDEVNRNDLQLTAGTVTVNGINLVLASATTSGTARIEVVDDAGQTTDSDNYTITVVEPLQTFQTILLDAPTGDKASKTFFSTSNGTRYSVNEVNSGAAGTSANIDFGYYYGASNNASLASPSDYPSGVYDLTAEGWNTLNTTTFKTTSMTQSQFNEVTTLTQVQNAYNSGTAAGNVKTQLAVGNVLAFQTDADKTGGSKVGLLLVSALSPGTESDKYIQLEIIVQE